jgi:TldD protein
MKARWRWPAKLALVAGGLVLLLKGAGTKAQEPAGRSEAAAASDPLLRAMKEELARSKAQLKMEDVEAPYYIEYRLSDVEQYDAEAAFGALRQNDRSHARSIRVVVRVGDYKQDSYYGPGQGVVNLAPVDNDERALRWQLWLATDQAYKLASQALAAKKAAQREFSADQGFDDFAREPAVESIGPVVKLDYDGKAWIEALEKATALFRTDAQIESMTASARFRAINQYLVNSEGTTINRGYAVYSVALDGTTQASDGMRLERSPYYATPSAKELPVPEKLQADAAAMIATLKKLREAPMVEEDYRGPVLFSPDAASDIFDGMIADNVLGIRPKPGDAARTAGEFAANYKGRVLPKFLSVADDPTLAAYGGKTLLGSYSVDDEGVAAAKVSLIEKGELVNYLIGREPIRDFPESNGHGRAAPGQPTSPSIGNLIIESSEGLSPEQLKAKLIELSRDDGKPYGYFVDTLGGQYEPRLLYRVYVRDGHTELVRGAVFDELDLRSLRNDVVAAGNDAQVSNRQSAIPTTVIAPSILFDELEVKRTDAKNLKLPEYPVPQFSSQ